MKRQWIAFVFVTGLLIPSANLLAQSDDHKMSDDHMSQGQKSDGKMSDDHMSNGNQNQKMSDDHMAKSKKHKKSDKQDNMSQQPH